MPLYTFLHNLLNVLVEKKKTPWSESASELYWPIDRRLSAKWLPTFANRGRHVVSVTDPYGRILGFLDRSRSFSFQVDSQLYSRGWVYSVPVANKMGLQKKYALTNSASGRFILLQVIIFNNVWGTLWIMTRLITPCSALLPGPQLHKISTITVSAHVQLCFNFYANPNRGFISALQQKAPIFRS
jgi:hypothetical protein